MAAPPQVKASAGARIVRVRWLATIAGCAMLLASVAIAGQVLAARQHLINGVQDLQAATNAVGALSLVQDSAVRARDRGQLAAARRQFGAARADLRLSSPLLIHLGWVPVIGQQLAAAPRAADASFYATSAALRVFSALQSLWQRLDTHANNGLLPAATALQEGHAEFVAAVGDADRASSALQLLPPHTGNTALDRARARLQRDLPIVRRASVWLAVAPGVLGTARPSRYLVALEDQTELRATGGFIAAADFVTVRDGVTISHFSDSSLPHEIHSVLVPLPEAAYTPETRWIFRDSNWSPDFPLSARLERWFYGEDTGQWADGVVDLTDAGVVRILAATGPLYLPEYHRWVDARNVLALTQQYVNGPYKGPLRVGAPDSVRKQFLGAVIRELFYRIQALPLQRWPTLGLALAAAASRGDLLVYDRRPAVEAAVRDAHASGDIARPPGDSLYMVDDNRSYNKINPYVHEWATYRVAIRPDLWLDSTLTIHYRVAPSPSNLEGFGPGYGVWGTKHDYQDFLRVYVPRGARLRNVSGLQAWAPASAYGLTQFAGRLLVKEGGTATVTIRYSIPANVFAASRFERYRLNIQRQPSSGLMEVRVTLQGLAGVQLVPKRARPVPAFNTTVRLDRDPGIDVGVQGITSPKPVVLPPLPAVPDPYIPFSYLYDYDPRHSL